MYMENELNWTNIGINLYDLHGSKTSEGFKILEWELINAMAIIDIMKELIAVADHPGLINYILHSGFPVGAS